MPEAFRTTSSHAIRRAHFVAVFHVSMLALTGCNHDVPERQALPSVAASGAVTVSGISSGGYMAGQFQVAFSEEVSGAGIVAAGPWGCAKGDISRAMKTCISGDGLDPTELRELTEVTAGIDATSNLKNTRLFLFRGKKDAVIGSKTADALHRWFAHYVDDANIRYVTNVPAGHGWPTIGYGSDCDVFAAPYINNCAYDLAGELLSHLYPGLEPPASMVRTAKRFDQREFGDANLADIGYVYVPEACESTAACRVHVFFHGCEQSANNIGTELVDNAGFNRWAESNNIVMLYPQVEKSLASPMNPLGCWDWWGYTGDNYLEKSGPQLRAVRKMVATLRTPAR